MDIILPWQNIGMAEQVAGWRNRRASTMHLQRMRTFMAGPLMDFNRFPAELLYMIVEEIEDPKILARLSQTSFRMREIVLRHQYHTIRLDSYDHEACRQFVRTLLENPYRAKEIRRIVFE